MLLEYEGKLEMNTTTQLHQSFVRRRPSVLFPQREQKQTNHKHHAAITVAAMRRRKRIRQILPN